MKFDVYYGFKTRAGKLAPGVVPHPTDLSAILELMATPSVIQHVNDHREGKVDAKIQLPAVCWTGICSKTRANKWMRPTQMVMVDIDHCENVEQSWAEEIATSMGEWLTENVLIAHLTPSRGLRIVFRAQEGKSTLKENMEWIRQEFELSKYGDFDEAVHDFSRLSFLGKREEVLYIAPDISKFEGLPEVLQNQDFEETADSESAEIREGIILDEFTFTDDEVARFEAYEYKGTNPKIIVDKWVEVQGKPSQGEVHNYYNLMVKNFRNIVSNDKRMLLWMLPRFGHSMDECWSQIKSICKSNTISRLEKDFYFFLKDNGFYPNTSGPVASLKKAMMEEQDVETENYPFLPPVFRQIVRTVPKDFVLPVINSLMPILGTLTSYAQAKYPYDNRMHTTSFFSVIYAPPGTGKGFVERFMDLLFEELRIRDFIQSERENIYLRVMQKKGANDKAPDMPHTSLRLIPPKNSEAEFLQKQRDNHGYHMFTYAAEMDSWAKGVKAAGGNKDDMIRIAWDNGEYGQQFKSVNTFKGTVNLYWNVLITGTLQQLESYFKNVENGLVTRCCFTSIENQEFAAPPVWKELSKKSKEEIREFARMCDAKSYQEPCNLSVEDVEVVSDENFDKEVPWKFKFRERETKDCLWIMPTIEAFHQRHLKKAALDLDNARDVFRRRVAVRGFRLALMCCCLYKNPRKRDYENCAKFIDWWMERDLESALKLWGAKYNEATQSTPNLSQRSVYDSLGDTFSRNDVYVVCARQGIKTPIRRILHDWKKLGCIEIKDKDVICKKR